VKLVATHEGRAIVANKAGGFFSAQYTVEGDAVKLGPVERLNVPVVTPGQMGSQARKAAREAVPLSSTARRTTRAIGCADC
jgi:hypothetical protein